MRTTLGSTFSRKKETGIFQYALKVQHIFEKRWCKESPAIFNFKYKEIFIRGLPKKLENIVHERQVKHTLTVMETYIPFHSLAKFVAAEGITNETIRPLDVPMQYHKATSKRASQKYPKFIIRILK